MVKLRSAFTLVELLIVISVLGVLITLTAGGLRNSLFRGSDAQRKSDLKQIASALESYLNDHGVYPNDSGGLILACPSTTNTACAWGESEMTDTKTVYFRVVPKDPAEEFNYYYRIVPDADAPNKKFQLFAHLESSYDKNCLEANCKDPTVPAGVSCGNESCNFAITSTNTVPTE